MPNFQAFNKLINAGISRYAGYVFKTEMTNFITDFTTLAMELCSRLCFCCFVAGLRSDDVDDLYTFLLI
jgi:hypothetical protein